MGASIKMHIEVKDKQGSWHHYHAPHMFRQTEFFDLVAGFYHPTEAIVPPRGLPADLSMVTRFCHEQDKSSYKLKSEGWLGADELEKLQKEIDRRHPFKNGCRENEPDLEFGYFHALINDNCGFQHQGWEDVRLVCWFEG